MYVHVIYQQIVGIHVICLHFKNTFQEILLDHSLYHDMLKNKSFKCFLEYDIFVFAKMISACSIPGIC